MYRPFSIYQWLWNILVALNLKEKSPIDFLIPGQYYTLINEERVKHWIIIGVIIIFVWRILGILVVKRYGNIYPLFGPALSLLGLQRGDLPQKTRPEVFSWTKEEIFDSLGWWFFVLLLLTRIWGILLVPIVVITSATFLASLTHWLIIPPFVVWIISISGLIMYLCYIVWITEGLTYSFILVTLYTVFYSFSFLSIIIYLRINYFEIIIFINFAKRIPIVGNHINVGRNGVEYISGIVKGLNIPSYAYYSNGSYKDGTYRILKSVLVPNYDGFVQFSSVYNGAGLEAFCNFFYREVSLKSSRQAILSGNIKTPGGAPLSDLFWIWSKAEATQSNQFWVYAASEHGKDIHRELLAYNKQFDSIRWGQYLMRPRGFNRLGGCPINTYCKVCYPSMNSPF